MWSLLCERGRLGRTLSAPPRDQDVLLSPSEAIFSAWLSLKKHFDQQKLPDAALDPLWPRQSSAPSV